MSHRRIAVLMFLFTGALFGQPRVLSLAQSRFTAPSGGRIVLDASPESVTFMRAARSHTAQAAHRSFAVAPELKGSRVILAIPLTTEPGEYDIALSFTGATREERTAAVHVSVTPVVQPEATAAVPPVVLLDGLQLATDGSCPISTDSSGTFGNLQQYLGGAPNNVANVYFFENCAECPKCSIEQLGADLATFLSSLSATQVDVVAHSIGGSIVRAYLAGKSATPGVFAPPASPKIRKAVFLATPHFGSPLADEIQTNALLSALYGGDAQILEMQRASQFQWDLATWNQFGDDLRGVDAVSAVGNAGPSQQSDGVVDLTSASLDFAAPGRTRVIPYCHISSTDFSGLAGALTGCNAAGIAFIDSPTHPSYQIVSSFLLGTAAWQSIGTSATQDATLSHFGGMMVGQVTAAGQYVQTLRTATWGTNTLTDGATAGEFFYNDFIPPGTATFSLTALGSSATTCGPVTEPAGFYSTFRCKASPAISAVAPLASGTAKLVASGGNITITGTGFGAAQCAACGVTASGKALQVSIWSDTSITAAFPGSFSGYLAIGVTTAAGSDTIHVMAAPTSAFPSVVINGVTNSASGAVGAVAPGELIAIYGTGLGPTIGASFTVDTATGGVDTTLAGTRVLFGAVAAPISLSPRRPRSTPSCRTRSRGNRRPCSRYSRRPARRASQCKSPAPRRGFSRSLPRVRARRRLSIRTIPSTASPNRRRRAPTSPSTSRAAARRIRRG